MNAVLLRELEKLRGGAIERLRMKYREVFGAEPRSKHKQQLFRQLAWRMQALAEGELSERARRRADEIGRDADLRTLPPREWLATGLIATPRAGVRLEVSRHDRRIPVAGTRLSRDYRGNPVVVQVLAEGLRVESEQAWGKQRKVPSFAAFGLLARYQANEIRNPDETEYVRIKRTAQHIGLTLRPRNKRIKQGG